MISSFLLYALFVIVRDIYTSKLFFFVKLSQSVCVLPNCLASKLFDDYACLLEIEFRIITVYNTIDMFVGPL